MTFLEKIKAKRAAENNEATSPVVQATNQIVEEKKEEVKKTSPLQGILARKKAAEAAKKAETEQAEAKAEEAVKSTSAKEQKVEEVKAEAVAEAPVKEAEEAAPAKEEAKTSKEEKTEAPAETTKEEAPKAEEATEEVAEEPKKKTRKPRKKATKKETAEEAAPAPTLLNAREFEIQDIMGSKMSFEEMVAKYESAFEDEAWEEYKAEVTAELENIKVAADMNPGMLRVTLTQLSDLDGMITLEHAKFKGLLESLTNKEDGVCTCIRYQAMANGANENERRANGYAALTNGTYEGEPINFMNLIAGTRLKYIFLESIKQRIKFMSNLCITFLGAMKVENSMDITANAAAK